jgi:predicted dehydrogenase
VSAWAPERVEMCLAALNAGARGLWIEKAIACSLDDAERLREALARSGATAIVDHPRRADARYRAVKRIIDQDTLGELQTVNCLMSGNLMHTGTHAWDILLFWCGAWRDAQGWLDQAATVDPSVSDAGGHAHVRFENGVHAYVTGRNKHYYIFQFDLVFDRGRIQIGNDVQTVMTPRDSRLYSGFRELFATDEVPLSDPYPHPMLHDLVHAMETGDEPVMSVGHAVDAFALGLALFQSHRDGHRALTPGELDPHLAIESV